MKIIDFERKGNVVRFYLGNDDNFDYWGDDWNDYPYDCNAGRVYSKYIVGTHDISFSFDYKVFEPCDGVLNCNWCKEDMKKRKVPCIIAVPPEVHQNSWDDRFDTWVCVDGIQKFYFDDIMKPDK